MPSVSAAKAKSAVNTARKYGKKYAEGGRANDAIGSFIKERMQNDIRDSVRSREYDPLIYQASKGLSPSRKHGDAIDYNADEVSSYRTHVKPMWDMADGGVADEGESWEPPPEEPETSLKPAPVAPGLDLRQAITETVKGKPALPPLAPGEQGVSSYEPSRKERWAQALYGEQPASPQKERLIRGLLGTTGLGEQNLSLSDLTPPGQIASAEEALKHGNLQDAALSVMPGMGNLRRAASKVTGTTAREVEALLKQHAQQKMATPPEHVPLDSKDFQKIGGQMGTNPGGVYADPATGEQWYIKKPPTADHANNEKLASELYKLAGVPVPEVKLTTLRGKPAIASQMIDGVTLNKIEDSAHVHNYGYNNLKEHFPADAWLGNYDATGTGKDNIIVDMDKFQAHRIDSGGALRYRAQGKLKDNFDYMVNELKTMKDPKINKDAADVFGGNTKEMELPSAQRIANIDPIKIADLVERYGPPTNAAKSDLLTKILARKQHIEEHYGVKPGGEPPNQFEQKPWTREDEAKSYGEHQPEPDGLGNDYEHPHQGEKSDPKHDADWLMEQNKGNPEYIAMDLHNMALQDPMRVDEVYKHLPHEIQPDVNAHLSQIIEEKGDPWAPKPPKTHPAEDPTVISDALKPLNWSEYKLPKPRGKPVYLPHREPEEVKKLGFNPDVPLYKGGAYTDYPDVMPNPKEKPDERAWFASDSPYIAQQYGPLGGDYIARAQKAFEIDWKQLDSSGGYSSWIMNKIIEEGYKKGADLLVIHGIHDMGGANQTQYAFLNPAALRATRAKFEEGKLHLAHPLAGLVGGGLFSYGMVKGDKKEGEMNRGGPTKKAGGGGVDHWMQHTAARNLHSEGMIKSPVPGRTDKLPMKVPAGSYVLPADFISALGQNNSQAGGQIATKMFSSGPYGMKTPNIKSGPAGRSKLPAGQSIRGKGFFADGGEADGDEHVPIIAAGGEFVIHPDVVRDIGHGSMTAGHKVLDKLVLKVRKDHIKTLQNLSPPKK